MVGSAIRAGAGPCGFKAASARVRMPLLIRSLMIVLLAVAVGFGINTPGGLAHDALEAGQPIAAAVQAVQGATSVSKSNALAASDHGAVDAPCSGHCAAHALGLLSSPTYAVPFTATPAQWDGTDNQLWRSWRSLALERPPRV